MPVPIYDVTVANGKYRFVYYDDATPAQAFRHGEPWDARTASMVGDNALMELVAEVADLREKLSVTETISDPSSATVEVEIDWDHVANAIVGVVEGGYSPWFGRLDEDQSDPLSVALRQELIDAGEIWWAEARYYRGGGKLVMQYDGPEDEEGTFEGQQIIGAKELKKGFALMAKKAPRHFADMVSENDDAITHDVFVRMVLLGDIVYG